MRLWYLGLAMAGVRRMAGSASLRARTSRPARRLIRGISRRALRRAKGQVDLRKKNRKNKRKIGRNGSSRLLVAASRSASGPVDHEKGSRGYPPRERFLWCRGFPDAAKTLVSN